MLTSVFKFRDFDHFGEEGKRRVFDFWDTADTSLRVQSVNWGGYERVKPHSNRIPPALGKLRSTVVPRKLRLHSERSSCDDHTRR